MILLKECIMAFIGTIAFALLFSVPKRYFPWCGTIGAAGWLVYRLTQQLGNRLLAAFLATVLVIILSRLVAVRERCPVTIFMVSGLFPLVPGVGIYWTIYELVMENMEGALRRGTAALQDAIAIVIGIIVVFELPQKLFSIARKRKL